MAFRIVLLELRAAFSNDGLATHTYCLAINGLIGILEISLSFRWDIFSHFGSLAIPPVLARLAPRPLIRSGRSGGVFGKQIRIKPQLMADR